MGDNTLPTAQSRRTIPTTHHNGLVQAFLDNIVPRNATRVAADLAGSLGTSLLRWSQVFTNRLNLGRSANNQYITASDTTTPRMDFQMGTDNFVWTQGRFQMNIQGSNPTPTEFIFDKSGFILPDKSINRNVILPPNIQHGSSLVSDLNLGFSPGTFVTVFTTSSNTILSNTSVNFLISIYLSTSTNITLRVLRGTTVLNTSRVLSSMNSYTYAFTWQANAVTTDFSIQVRVSTSNVDVLEGSNYVIQGA